MGIDAGRPIRRRKQPDIWRLPDVLDLRILRHRYEPPRRMTIQGVDHQLKDVVMVVVRLSEPFVIRALGPVLWVGDEPLTVAESDKPTEMRFVVPNPEALEAEAPITLSWNAAGAPRKPTRFRYRPPENGEDGRQPEKPIRGIY